MVRLLKIIVLLVSLNIQYGFSKNVQVSNPDTSDIERPCSFDDRPCIKRYFMKRRWCQIGRTQDPNKPYKVDGIIYNVVPFLNATSIEEDVVISGLGNGKISEFYVNKKTKTALFSIKFTDILFRGSATIKFHRNEKEPITFYGPDIKEMHSLTEVTTTIPDKIRHIFQDVDLDTYAVLQNTPTYDFGEGMDDIKDPEILAIIGEIQKDVQRVAKELNGPRVPIFVDFYIRNVICR